MHMDVKLKMDFHVSGWIFKIDKNKSFLMIKDIYYSFFAYLRRRGVQRYNKIVIEANLYIINY